MTDLRALHDLYVITRAHYTQKKQTLGRLVEEENRLRKELARLDDMDRATRNTDNSAIPMKSIGADVIWQGWTARTRTALNIELARVLSVKEHHLKEVRRAYGKVLVVADLQKNFRKSRKMDAAARELAKAIDHSLR